MTNAYDEPEGIAPRGTVIVAPGRGETAAAYARFGRRIAADGYRVRVPDRAGVEKLLVDDGLPGPKVIVGSDTGALVALDLAARQVPGLDAIVLAGLPVPRPVNLTNWEAEVEARTSCPNHQRVLTGGGALRGGLSVAPGEAATGVTLPSLGLHGDADTISPLEEARPLYPGTLVAIAGGKHDVLNDVTHRTVAATVVLFLERLRLGADLPVIAQVQR
ncbi:lysophospholipase [Actinoplanes bogorensis]|uniref:Lysophospholipase n=1 Tax=Paractinoplanes bogorensis TaxID=1610840 RepID=A0ABS5YTK9_9ACTN|nr:lysophospholipase [Actinoplanes bogorensis]MBU2665385.1 lysophospholipase [Actinoplanes bogorensis]